MTLLEMLLHDRQRIATNRGKFDDAQLSLFLQHLPPRLQVLRGPAAKMWVDAIALVRFQKRQVSGLKCWKADMHLQNMLQVFKELEAIDSSSRTEFDLLIFGVVWLGNLRTFGSNIFGSTRGPPRPRPRLHGGGTHAAGRCPRAAGTAGALPALHQDAPQTGWESLLLSVYSSKWILRDHRWMDVFTW